MLAQKRRIKKDSFSLIMKEGLFLHTPGLYIRVLDRKDDQPSLFGFVVPSKVCKTSVGRHFLKRQMTAVVEKKLTNIRPGFSTIFFLKKDFRLITGYNLESEILELLERAKILN